eukprot:3648581-Pleurochrysis_carterae.AAC.3
MGKQLAMRVAVGLPLGVTLPGSQQQLQQATIEEEQVRLARDDDDASADGAVRNKGAARAKGETAEERHLRKQAAKDEKQARRQEKKATKCAYVAERNKQLAILQRTQQIPSTNLSRGD